MLPSIRAALEARNPMRSYCEKALFDTRLLSGLHVIRCTAHEEARSFGHTAMRLARYFRFRKGFSVELFARRPAALCLKRRKALNVQRCDLHIVSALEKTRRQVVHALPTALHLKKRTGTTYTAF